MFHYHGGKQRIAPEIAEIIHEYVLEDEEIRGRKYRYYVEPFVGAGSVLLNCHRLFEDHKPKLIYKAGDTNESLVMMWKKITDNGWKPPNYISEENYYKLSDKKRPSALAGYFGYTASFRGIYFNTYDPRTQEGNRGKNISERAREIGKELKDVKFSSGNYTQFSGIKNAIIYCDPPYSKQNIYYDGYHNKLSFDSEEFFDWCRDMSDKNNLIFVSEYKAPRDFKKIYSNKDEKLFLID